MRDCRAATSAIVAALTILAGVCTPSSPVTPLRQPRPASFEAKLIADEGPLSNLVVVRLRSLERGPLCLSTRSFSTRGMRIEFFQNGEQVYPNSGGSPVPEEWKGINVAAGVDIVTAEPRSFIVNWSTLTLKKVKTTIRTNFDIYRCSDWFDDWTTPVRASVEVDLSKHTLSPMGPG